MSLLQRNVVITEICGYYRKMSLLWKFVIIEEICCHYRDAMLLQIYFVPDFVQICSRLKPLVITVCYEKMDLIDCAILVLLLKINNYCFCYVLQDSLLLLKRCIVITEMCCYCRDMLLFQKMLLLQRNVVIKEIC